MSEENNNNVTEIQVAQEEPKLKEEPQFAKQERKEKLRKYILFAVVLAVVMSVLSTASFNAGKKSVQDEANAKVAKLEQKLQQEYIDQKYALVEKHYEIFTLLKEGRGREYCIESLQWEYGKFSELGDEALDNLVLANVNYPPYFPSEIKRMNDEEALAYIETLKDVVEKYPYSIDINNNIIYRIELLEERCTEQLHKAETFGAIDALKKQCEANKDLWK